MKYTEIIIDVDREALDLVEAELIGAGFDSLMIDDPDDMADILANKEKYKYDYINESLSQNLARKPQITLYFEIDEKGQAEQDRVRTVLASFGDKIEIKEELTDDNDWLYKWQEYFKPTKVTNRLVVKPTWEEYEPRIDEASGQLEKIIEIDPGMAFGTGTHETTSMCMKALEKAIDGEYGDCDARRVLDVGCGSGILAIAAALLGAEEALGIEIDTDAVEVAKSNVQLNNLTDCIDIRYGDLTKGVDYLADIVVANLMADLVVMLTPDVAAHLKSGGKYISSGILNEKEEMVSIAIKEAGFRIEEVLHDGEWCAIVASLDEPVENKSARHIKDALKSSCGEIKAVHFEQPDDNLSETKSFGLEKAKKVNTFHKSFPEYSHTPLVELKNRASALGIKDLYVKNESCRFGLNAFKVLGGSYAIGNIIAEKLGVDISELTYERMISPAVKTLLGDTTFVTATDGNHGRGVAWTAERLGQRCVIYMPKGSSEERLENIRAHGAKASITDLNYDDAVRLANEGVDKHGWLLVQDTAWEGYEDIPRWIMEGYLSMAYEAALQLGEVKPTHIFLQAGVGAMAGAVCGFFADYYGDEARPVITVVEPNAADCIYRSAAANDGDRRFVTGDMPSIMAGLCCGEPCTIGWEILRDHADNFISVPDTITEKGMRLLGKPLTGDERIISGESGACTSGLLAELMENEDLSWLKQQLGLDENSIVLCFSTEGDTDKASYQRIVGE